MAMSSENDLSEMEQRIIDNLTPMFPTLTPEIIILSVKHPTNRRGDAAGEVDIIQRCVDDLLELRTYTTSPSSNVVDPSSTDLSQNIDTGVSAMMEVGADTVDDHQPSFLLPAVIKTTTVSSPESFMDTSLASLEMPTLRATAWESGADDDALWFDQASTMDTSHVSTCEDSTRDCSGVADYLESFNAAVGSRDPGINAHFTPNQAGALSTEQRLPHGVGDDSEAGGAFQNEVKPSYGSSEVLESSGDSLLDTEEEAVAEEQAVALPVAAESYSVVVSEEQAVAVPVAGEGFSVVVSEEQAIALPVVADRYGGDEVLTVVTHIEMTTTATAATPSLSSTSSYAEDSSVSSIKIPLLSRNVTEEIDRDIVDEQLELSPALSDMPVTSNVITDSHPADENDTLTLLNVSRRKSVINTAVLMSPKQNALGTGLKTADTPSKTAQLGQLTGDGEAHYTPRRILRLGRQGVDPPDGGILKLPGIDGDLPDMDIDLPDLEPPVISKHKNMPLATATATQSLNAVNGAIKLTRPQSHSSKVYSFQENFRSPRQAQTLAPPPVEQNIQNSTGMQYNQQFSASSLPHQQMTVQSAPNSQSGEAQLTGSPRPTQSVLSHKSRLSPHRQQNADYMYMQAFREEQAALRKTITDLQKSVSSDLTDLQQSASSTGVGFRQTSSGFYNPHSGFQHREPRPYRSSYTPLTSATQLQTSVARTTHQTPTTLTMAHHAPNWEHHAETLPSIPGVRQHSGMLAPPLPVAQPSPHRVTEPPLQVPPREVAAQQYPPLLPPPLPPFALQLGHSQYLNISPVGTLNKNRADVVRSERPVPNQAWSGLGIPRPQQGIERHHLPAPIPQPSLPELNDDGLQIIHEEPALAIVIPPEPVVVQAGAPQQEVVIGDDDDDGHRPVPQNEPRPAPAAVVVDELPTSIDDSIDVWLVDILSMLPDADEVYVREQLARFRQHPQPVTAVVNLMFESGYPKKQVQAPKPPSPVKVVVEVDYYKDYSSATNASGTGYYDQVVTLLRNDFLWVPVGSIRRMLSAYNSHYAPVHKCIMDAFTAAGIQISDTGVMSLVGDKENHQNASNSTPSASRQRLPGHITVTSSADNRPVKVYLLKQGRKRVVVTKHKDLHPLLKKEREYVWKKTKTEKEQSDLKFAAEMNEAEYEDSGQMIECGCCFCECPFESMVQCMEGHLFCMDCLRRYAEESVYGHGKANLSCMTTECDSTFPKSQLEKAVSGQVLKTFEDRVREEALNLANMEDLVRCPHCAYAAVMDPGDKVFKCQDPSCMRETCRFCKEEWKDHFGIPCEELEKKDETKMRLKYEEQMTKAMIRTCHKCKASFQKTDGCNKMTCRCGATQCYICRTPDITYRHFCGHPRNPGQPCDKCIACSLWMNAQEDDALAVKEIEKEAEKAKAANREAAGLEPPPNKKPRTT